MSFASNSAALTAAGETVSTVPCPSHSDWPLILVQDPILTNNKAVYVCPVNYHYRGSDLIGYTGLERVGPVAPPSIH